MDPLHWLARMSDHIPDPGQHRTLFYGEYANRVRGSRRPPRPEESPVAAEPPRKRCSPSWARLIAKVYQVDPLVCARCGQRMSIVAFIRDAFAIRRILDHLGLSTPEAEKPPPLREVLRVAEDGEGWGVPARVACLRVAGRGLGRSGRRTRHAGALACELLRPAHMFAPAAPPRPRPTPPR